MCEEQVEKNKPSTLFDLTWLEQIKSCGYLVDQLMVEMRHFQVPETVLRLRHVSWYQILFEQKIHLKQTQTATLAVCGNVIKHSRRLNWCTAAASVELQVKHSSRLTNPRLIQSRYKRAMHTVFYTELSQCLLSPCLLYMNMVRVYRNVSKSFLLGAAVWKHVFWHQCTENPQAGKRLTRALYLHLKNTHSWWETLANHRLF